MQFEPRKRRSGWFLQLIQIGVALFTVIFAGPVLTIAVASLLIILILGGCTVLIIAGAPYYLTQDHAEHQAEARATASFEAALLNQSLPANVEFFVAADGWNFSPSGDYAVLQVGSQASMFEVTTQASHPLKVDRGLRVDDTVWLDERRLFVFQSQSTVTGYGFVLFHLSEGPPFAVEKLWLPAVRAGKAEATHLANKDLFQNKSVQAGAVVAIDQTEGWVIDAHTPAEEQALAHLLADRPISIIPFYSRAEWRIQEAYPAPDGRYYAALWPQGTRLTIFRVGGEMVIETQATAFSPAPADCRLIPIHWLPDSRGVLFAVNCRGVQRAILLLAIPD